MGDIDRSQPMAHNYDANEGTFSKIVSTAKNLYAKAKAAVPDVHLPQPTDANHADPTTGKQTSDMDIVDQFAK